MKKWIALLLILVVPFVFFVGCGGTNDTDVPDKQEEAADKISSEPILFNGASTLAPVITEITKKFAEENQTWDKVDKSLDSGKIEIFVSGGGSGAGVKSVIDGTGNFGMVSRPVSDEEKSQIDGYQEYKLGTDALTISVNPENEIYKIKESISMEELQKIFSGEYQYWDDVDKSLSHEKIVLVTRDIGGGAHEVFQEKVMGDTPVSDSVIQAPSMGALVTKIIENKNAIGYASYGVVNQNEGKVIPLSVDGIEPTEENIASGKYTISRPLIIMTGGDINPYEKALIKYITSDVGKKIVEEMGFVTEK